jgi:hypothetical protein
MSKRLCNKMKTKFLIELNILTILFYFFLFFWYSIYSWRSKLIVGRGWDIIFGLKITSNYIEFILGIDGVIWFVI